jgi:hypothetical protein
MSSSKFGVGRGRSARLALATAVAGLVASPIASSAHAQSVYTMVRHGGNERTVEITTNFPRSAGCHRQFAIADTVDVTVSGWVDASSALQDAPAGFAEHVLGAVRSRLHLPATMTVGVFGPDSLAVAAVSGAVAFTLDPSGHVRNVHMVSKSTTGTFDGVLPDAVRDAASDHRYPKFPPDYHVDSVPFIVTLSTVVWGNGTAADVLGATAPAEMFGLTLERYRDIHLASDIHLPAGLSLYTSPEAAAAAAAAAAAPSPSPSPAAAGTPPAPPAAPAAPATPAPPPTGSAGAEGAVVWVEFVLGSDGRITPGTLRVLGTEPPATVTQVQTLLAQATMSPAMVAACAVPQLTRLALVVDQGAK